MAWVATAATVVSAGLSVYGSIKQSQAQRQLGADTSQTQIDMGVAQRDAAIQESKNLQYNAAVQRNQAEVEEIATARDISIFREEGDDLRARQRAQFAFTGLGAGGSVAAVLEDTANKINSDIAQLAFAGRARAANIRAGAELTERRARSVRRAGEIALRTGLRAAASTRGQASSLAGTSLLSGALTATNTLLSGFDRAQRLRPRT